MVQDGARWCKMVQDGARWCKMVQDGARWCKIVQYHAIPCKTMQYHAKSYHTMQNHAILCNAMQYHAIPCNTMQYHAIQWNTMLYHASLRTADGAYHCPVGSIMAIFYFSHLRLPLQIVSDQRYFQSRKSPFQVWLTDRVWPNIAKYGRKWSFLGAPCDPRDHFRWVQRGRTGPPICEIQCSTLFNRCSTQIGQLGPSMAKYC